LCADTLSNMTYQQRNLRSMSVEARRAYFRERQQAHRLLKGPSRHKPKPDNWTCSECNVEKPFTGEHFYEMKANRWGLAKRCKQCMKLMQCAKKFGITVEEYVSLTTGTCAICGEAKKLHLDHCHNTGRIRAGLCNGCNAGLGFFCDDPARLAKAIDYVVAHDLLA
jgi:hypothetical protein